MDLQKGLKTSKDEKIFYPLGLLEGPTNFCFFMGTEDSKDLLKNLDWKALGNNGEGSAPAGPVTKKRLPKKIREVPEYYFLPRRSLPSAIAIYGAIIAAGVGAGMLVEVWINKKIREDGGIIWEMDKS
ncbi:hypothetical protein H6P81_019042 [Aristolochia fimbriata]|uniref:Uncharacterized protein n=1 Tax=Aristolochia fimbriata TaxID=158543 RepID=A0AAV7E3N2_ARIFI|nr:hypothetical protein H6P81_019042 [Aristolochia fimbriata]